MAFKTPSRACETTESGGDTGTYVLEGNKPGYRPFDGPSVFADGDQSFFEVLGDLETWEIILGTYNASGPSVTRDQVYITSAGNQTPIDWGAGVKEIRPVLPGLSDLDAAGRQLLLQAMGAGGGGGFRDLKIDFDETDAVITATRFPLESSDGGSYMARNVNVTCSPISTTGANGRDAGSWTADWWYLYIIHNPATGAVASLASLSATSPTLPSGYTFKGICGVLLNTAEESWQRGDCVYSSNRTPTNASGGAGNIDISDVVPPFATEVFGSVTLTGITTTSGERRVGLMAGSNGSGSVYVPFRFPIQTPQTMLVFSDSGGIAVHGFRIPI